MRSVKNLFRFRNIELKRDVKIFTCPQRHHPFSLFSSSQTKFSTSIHFSSLSAYLNVCSFSSVFQKSLFAQKQTPKFLFSKSFLTQVTNWNSTKSFQKAFFCTKQILQANEIEEEKIKILLNKGNEYFLKELHDEALKVYDEVLKINPHCHEALNNKGVCLYYLGKFKEASECYDELIKRKDRDPAHLFNKAVCLVNLKQVDDSIKLLDQLLTNDPTFKQALFYKGVVYYENGQFLDALHQFNKFLAVYPEGEMVAELIYHKGNCFLKLNQPEEAIKCYDEVLNFDSTLKEVWVQKGCALNNLKRPMDAIPLFNKAIELDPSYADAYSQKAESYKQVNDFMEMLKTYNALLQVDPKNENAWFSKAVIFQALEKFDEAAKCFETVKAINPNSEIPQELLNHLNAGLKEQNKQKLEELTKYKGKKKKQPQVKGKQKEQAKERERNKFQSNNKKPKRK